MRGLVAAVAVGAALGSAGFAHAGTVTLANNVMTYQAGAGEANRVFVVQDLDGMQLIELGTTVTAGAGCSQVNANEAFCETEDAGLLTIVVAADDQSDYVDLRPTQIYWRSILDGGAGGDELIAGNAAFENVFDGGPGGDTFSGRGTVDYSMRTNPVSVTIGDSLANDGESGENDFVPDEITRVLGGEGGDTLTALDSPNVQATSLIGGDGADTLTVLRQFSFGRLEGGPGADELQIGDTQAIALGGEGNDLLVGGHDSQTLQGEGGDDEIRGNAGRDRLIGGSGADTINGGPAKDSVSGGHGADTILARDHKRDALDGGAGVDRARVDEGLDRLLNIEELF
jgi:Ca2+-binding RTX toxin-like protein